MSAAAYTITAIAGALFSPHGLFAILLALMLLPVLWLAWRCHQFLREPTPRPAPQQPQPDLWQGLDQ